MTNLTGDERRTLIEDALADWNPDALFMDGLESAIIGVASQFTYPPRVVYSRTLIIEALIAGGMDHEEAEEYFSFNIEGAWVGEQTPLILTFVEDLADG